MKITTYTGIAKFLIVVPFIIIYFLKFYLKYFNKKNIILYHHGWGVGHVVHDMHYFIRYLSDDNVVVLFLNDGKHNKKLSLIFKHISLNFIDIYITVPILNKKILLNKEYSVFIYKLFKKILFFKSTKWVNTYEDMRGIISKKHGFKDKDDKFARFIESNFFTNMTKPSIKHNEYNFGIDRQILKYFNFEINKYKEKILCFYLRDKGNDKRYPEEYYRSSGKIENYFKTFKYLIDSDFKILIYGDYDYSKILSNGFQKDIICAESLQVSKDIFCIYAALNCNYFLAAVGGGTYFPFLRKEYPKTLILDGFPFGYVIPNATLVYKSVKDKDNNYISSETLLSNSDLTYEIKKGWKIISNNEDLILNSTIEFLDYHKNKHNYKEDFINLPMDLNFINCNARISPIWLKFNP